MVVVRAFSRTVLRPCSVCGFQSRRVHSRYERRICDRPAAGRSAVILLTVRRFFCENSACERRTLREAITRWSSRVELNGLGRVRQRHQGLPALLG
ncbi:transposase family protein [Streptomyces sp. NPDC055059]